jgi:ABC-type glycerol-3-phosphate transport system permease component
MREGTLAVNARTFGGHAVLIALSVACLAPIYWMLVTSLKPPTEIFERSLLPASISFENYAFVWKNVPVGRMLTTTFLMAALQTVGQLLTSLLAAYAFARWRFPGDNVLFLLFVGTWLVPLQVTMLPNYVLVARLGWLDTLAALVVPQLAAAFSIVLMRQYMKAFPRDLMDASQLDGANSWRTLWGIVVPNLRAPLAALGILLFISAWNEYFWPLLVTRKIESSVIQVGLQMFMTQEGDLWGPMMAAATLASLPIFVLYLILQRQVIDAFIRSGLR